MESECVCVCVCEREREIQRSSERKKNNDNCIHLGYAQFSEFTPTSDRVCDTSLLFFPSQAEKNRKWEVKKQQQHFGFIFSWFCDFESHWNENNMADLYLTEHYINTSFCEMKN